MLSSLFFLHSTFTYNFAPPHQTYLTPEGELYDTSVIESNNVDNSNIKRENKAYSYKEQMEELALR